MPTEQSRREARRLLSLTPEELRIEAVAMSLDGQKASENSAVELRKLDWEVLETLLKGQDNAELPETNDAN